MAKTSSEVRNSFLSFFQKNGHEVVASGPVCPPNDPSILFANAGMVQFKDLFLGLEKRSYSRATTSQKCIRISGKHNDLENVGPSPRHHTFFEMLGNFSFGDYFKEQAIVLAWDYVKSLDLPKDRLCVTYFGGEGSVPADTEARTIWKKVSGLPDTHIIGCGMKDNFWQMGDTGPCGPCSELHYFLGNNPDVSKFGEEQTPEGFGWIEFWNLVFMQFNRDASGTLNPLPAPSIDTGMGLERMSLIVQGKTSNYETDLLRELVDTAARIAKKPYHGSMSNDDVSMRVIADHARLTAFLLSEGIMPDTNGREYVLRRVMRRAIRHGHRLGIAQPFLHEVALAVTRLMGDQYPELREKADHIASVTEQEEVRFRRTIERGLVLLDERFVELQGAGKTVLGGADAFRLYDTFGFPLDLTEVICKERGFGVDEAGYETALEEARKRSEFKGIERAVEGVYRDALLRVGAPAVSFTGYETEQSSETLRAIIANGALVESLNVGDEAELVFANTPFYAESGGQLGDSGLVRSATAEFEVTDTQRPIAGLSVLRGKLIKGLLKLGENLAQQVDTERRNATRRNHSATHLLHHALRAVLGGHAQQKGSQVGPDRLRFDFTHNAAVTREQLQQIEDLVNADILRNVPIKTEELGMEEARGRGAMMLFGEKYGERVRVLSMADSVELCGGTHARATGDIGMLKVVAEQGVAAGVRRITAVTGGGALAYLRELENTISRAGELVKATSADLPSKIEKLISSERSMSKRVAELQRKLASGGGSSDGPLSSAREINGVKVLGFRTEVTDRSALRELAEQLRDQLGKSAVMVVSEVDGKVQMVVTVAKELTAQYAAGKVIRGAAEAVGGSGGGRPDMAQAGGTNPAAIPQAIEAFYKAFEAN